MKLKENIPQNSDIKDKRIHLENSITHVLDPWMDKAEENLFATGLRKVPEEKLAQMEQFLQQENTPAQEKLITKTILFEGYLDFTKKELRKSYATLTPVMFLAIIGTLGLCYGTIKKDVKTVVASCAANTAGYYLADTTQKKFLKRTKEARRFWDDLVRDQEERNRIHTEYQRWYKPSHQM